MSANLDESLPVIYTEVLLTEKDPEYTYLLVEFDEHCDQDVKQITEYLVAKAARRKYYTKVCVMRTLTFFIDVASAWVMMGTQAAKRRCLLQKALISFVFGKSDEIALIQAIQKYMN